MRYLPIIALTLAGCTGQARQTHLAVADAISQSVNTVAPAVVEEYKIQLRTCRVESATFPDYQLCAAQVDMKWSHFRDLYRNIRDLQDKYATALEKKDPGLADYVEWLQTAWCQLESVAPFKMPQVPGVKCDDR